jgi:hypothetical protein
LFFFIVGRVIIIDGFQLSLKLSLTRLSCFDLSTLGSKSQLFLLGFCLSCLSPFLLFFLLDLSSLHLLLKCVETSLSCLAFLPEFGFLACSVIPAYS